MLYASGIPVSYTHLDVYKRQLMEYGENYLQYKPIHAELKKLKNGWTNKRDKYEEAHRAELTLWNAASRYLHANLTDTKTVSYTHLDVYKRQCQYPPPLIRHIIN